MNELKEKFGKKETNPETTKNGETMDNDGVPAKVKKENIFAKAWSGIKKFLNKEFTVKLCWESASLWGLCSRSS